MDRETREMKTSRKLPWIFYIPEALDSLRHVPQPPSTLAWILCWNVRCFSFHWGKFYWTSITSNQNGTRSWENDPGQENGTYGGDSFWLFNLLTLPTPTTATWAQTVFQVWGPWCPVSKTQYPYFIWRRLLAKELGDKETMYSARTHCWKVIWKRVPGELCSLSPPHPSPGAETVTTIHLLVLSHPSSF